MLRPLAVAVAAACVLTGCGATSGVSLDELTELAAAAHEQRAAAEVPDPAPPAPADPSPPAPAWSVGASPLPLRDDGFGEVQLTPEVLRDRRLPTRSLLPPPPGGRWASSTGPVTPEIRERMGESWSPACPVDLSDLRYVTVAFRGFDGLAHTGELVLAAHVVDDVVGVFEKLFAADFPIEEMRLVTTEDHHAPPTGDGNSTAAYNCRSARGSSRWSEHALGTAVDINPFQNPMVKRDVVIPELASAYVDRTDVRPGMVVEPGVVVDAFAEIGWGWGGHWHSSKDWMHFSAGGT